MNTVAGVRNLSFQYNGGPVLSGVSLEIEKGDFVAIIGSNGTGKSTLLRLLLGEILPSEGEISLFGQNLAGFRDWPRIGYVPQNNPASVGGFPATAEEIVCASLYSRIGPMRPVKKAYREKALAALSLVGMRGCAKRMISELSGGQIQRVMIARALAADCELMLLDEPTTGIDADSADRLYVLLRDLNKQGMTILMVTHDMGRAIEYVGRTLCLEDGTIVELNREQMIHELSHKHKHPH